MPQLFSLGARGPDVRQVQAQLNTKISDLPLLVADGIFGQQTHARVIEFQSNSGLTPDGIVGPLTLSALSQGGGTDQQFEEYQQLVQLALTTLSTQKGDTSQGIAFFNRHKPVMDRLALSGLQIPASSLTATRSNLVGAPIPDTRAAIGLVLVAVVVVILVFFAAMAVINAQNSRQSAAEISRLQREFEVRMAELNRLIDGAPFEAIVLLAAMMSAVEAAIRDVVRNLQRQMERCRQISPQNVTKCFPLATVINDQFRVMI